MQVMVNSKSSFLKNLITIFIGSFATKLVSFLLVPLYTGVLSTDEFGSVDVAITTSSLLLPLFTGVIFEAVLRFSLDNTKNKSQVFSVAMYIDILGVAIFMVLSPLVFIYPPLSEYYLYFVLYFIALVFNDTLLYFARGLNEIKKYTVSSVIQTVVLCILNLYFLLVIKIGVQGYFLSYIISTLASSVSIWFLVKMNRYLIKLKSIDKKLTKEMLKYSLPLIPNTISWWISSSSDRYFIVAMCGIASNGVYAIASKIPTVISLGTSIFNTAWQISAVEEYGTEESKKKFSRMCFDYFSIILILGSGLIVFTKLMALILFKQDFFSAWIFVPPLVIASCFHAFSTFFGSVFTTTKNTKYMSITTFIGAVLNIIMNYYFILFWGVFGAAIATLVSYLIVYILRFVLAIRLYSFKVNVINDSICVVLLIVQMIVVCTQFWNVYLISIIVFCVIFTLRYKSIKGLFKEFIMKFKKNNV